MTALTRFRRSRIRHACAEDIARMSVQDSYWTLAALREILQRIERLNNEDPPQALNACESVARIVEYTRDVPPDLRALALAVHGAVLRRLGQPEAAIDQYESALGIRGLTPSGRGNVLARMAVAQVHLGQAEKGLENIEHALRVVTDPVPVLAVRGWIRMFTNPLRDALEDCLSVLEMSRSESRQDYSVFAAIINAANILSYEILEVDPALLERIQSEIDAYRKILPTGGSNYSKVRRPRLMLSRAEALLLSRTGREEKALLPLQRSAQGLRDQYPNDALDAYTDLMCLLGKLEKESEAALMASVALSLLDRVSWKVDPIGRNALLVVSKRGRVSHVEVMEIRTMLRSRKSLSCAEKSKT